MRGALRPILAPRSIAVIGASRTPGTIGHEIVANLVRGGYTGPVYPVNPKATSICSIRTLADITSVPEPVDLAVIVVPKELVHEVAEQCVRAGVGGLIVISAGFREVGGDGAAREQALRDLVRGAGIRMLGPNCMGVLNTAPEVRMNATFAPRLPPFGRVAFVSQSGALGLSVLDYAREYGIGIAQFVSVGNKADVSGNDLLLEWEDDPAIGAILMYAENFGNPARFLEIASRVSRKKPIIAVKSGRSRAGARAASSHTGALAASDLAVDALLTQAGVLRADSVQELFDLAMAFSAQASPRSRRTAVLTNAGGPGILAADALEPHGLELPELSAATVSRLRSLFPAEASLRNPLDMIASATPDGYRTALDGLLDDPQVDSAVAIFVPPLGISQVEVTDAIASVVVEHPDKPVFAVLMGHDGLPEGRAELHEVGVPAYIFPESAARALAARCRYREWRERPVSRPELLPVNREAAARLLQAARRGGRGRLAETDALDLLATYGLPVARAQLARNADEAAELAERMGFPVVVKIVAPAIVHKTEVGGVQIDLHTAAEVRAAHGAVVHAAQVARPDARIEGVLVQNMVREGRELILGMVRDPAYGALIMFGLGGVLVEVLGDVVFRIAPLSRQDARDMLRGIRGVKLLDGVRGAPPVDFVALENALLRLSQLALDFPEISEIDVNPVLAFEAGVMGVDARVVLSAATSPVRDTPRYSDSPAPVRPTR
jgi:acetyl coenzyme A synthetase (ADP forming)-like protein